LARSLWLSRWPWLAPGGNGVCCGWSELPSARSWHWPSSTTHFA